MGSELQELDLVATPQNPTRNPQNLTGSGTSLGEAAALQATNSLSLALVQPRHCHLDNRGGQMGGL